MLLSARTLSYRWPREPIAQAWRQAADGSETIAARLVDAGTVLGCNTVAKREVASGGSKRGHRQVAQPGGVKALESAQIWVAKRLLVTPREIHALNSMFISLNHFNKLSHMS
jgi:hypothetical protein